MSQSQCRSCGTRLEHTFVDLGMSPLANSYIKPERLNGMEPFYPLHVYVCAKCLLVQLEQFSTPHDIFSDYAYFSSFSDSWLAHAEAYVDMIAERFPLEKNSKVVEIASNDGYLLQNFVARGIPVLGRPGNPPSRSVLVRQPAPRSLPARRPARARDRRGGAPDAREASGRDGGSRR